MSGTDNRYRHGPVVLILQNDWPPSRRLALGALTPRPHLRATLVAALVIQAIAANLSTKRHTAWAYLRKRFHKYDAVFTLFSGCCFASFSMKLTM